MTTEAILMLILTVPVTVLAVLQILDRFKR